ncbi:transcriptional regulator domain-containing protein [Pandoraea horticolens]|uniref:transcriptional regulator domain-containing protein n=1 Tax=Pandoraea horticolens TaxID=2508298 RepID=UPI0012413E19|nr:DUF6499 domain-containing protein [Pandoraea horticolens]
MNIFLPDWTDESAYPDPADNTFTLSEWAWQFLRRNEGYQADWIEYVRSLDALANRVPSLTDVCRLETDPAFRRSAAGQAFRQLMDDGTGEEYDLVRDQVEWNHLSVAVLEGETSVTQVMRRAIRDGLPWRRCSYSSWLGRKWGMRRMRHPNLGGGAAAFVRSGVGFRELGARNPFVGSIEYCTPVFDLRLPVDVLRAQFECVISKKMMMKRARKMESTDAECVEEVTTRPERQRQNFRRYLQVLDAQSSGVARAEIVRVLRSDAVGDSAKTVRNWLIAAELLRDSAYLDLPLWERLSPQSQAKVRPQRS